MASTITHAYFILDVYDRLDIKTKEFLFDQKELLKVAAQSMDVLYFYNIMNFRKGSRIREFGHYFHNHQTLEFFETLINYIKYNGHGYTPEVMAYLYGMLSHYILDSIFHPYVIYKSGVYQAKNKVTHKYNQKHAELENFFDNYLILLKENTLPWKFPCHEFCFNINTLDKDLQEVIDFTYQEVFGIHHMSKFYLKAISHMKTFYRVFRYDPTSMKKKFYQVVDFLMPNSILHVDVLSYHSRVHKNLGYLNLEHHPWYFPTDKRVKRTSSMIELYTLAQQKTVETIRKINAYIYENQKLNFKKTLQNNSYLTGKDCSRERELKYFEF